MTVAVELGIEINGSVRVIGEGQGCEESCASTEEAEGEGVGSPVETVRGVGTPGMGAPWMKRARTTHIEKSWRWKVA